MSVVMLSDYRKNNFLGSGLTRLPPHPGPEHLELLTDWSPRKRLLFYIFAPLAGWSVVLGSIYALAQIL